MYVCPVVGSQSCSEKTVGGNWALVAVKEHSETVRSPQSSGDLFPPCEKVSSAKERIMSPSFCESDRHRDHSPPPKTDLLPFPHHKAFRGRLPALKLHHFHFIPAHRHATLLQEWSATYYIVFSLSPCVFLKREHKLHANTEKEHTERETKSLVQDELTKHVSPKEETPNPLCR